MMRQLFVFIVISIILVTNTQTISQPLAKHVNTIETEYMIPNEAIRLRILANSNSDIDQQIKYAVRDQVNGYISNIVAQIDDIDEARFLIHKHVPVLNELVAQT